MYKGIIIILFILVGVLCSMSINAQISLSHKPSFIADTSIDFNSLINKFKGKIVYVDIWATWCIPCRKELQSKKAVRGFEEYASKNNIVLLYIGGDKTKNHWGNFITKNNLVGYHILINQSINNTFHTTFSTVQNRKGIMKRSFYIPRHIIIDQTGAVVDSAADRQGSTSVYLKFNKLLGRAG